MDLNTINLPATVVAELYSGVLVDSGEITAKSQPITPVITEVKSDTGWKSLGNNQKNILIIVKYGDAVYLPDNELNFLTGMLSACKLTIGDTAIVNLENHPDAGYKELITHFKSKIVLLFDAEPSALGLPMNFPHFQIQPFANNSFLYAPSLKELEADKILKSKLWVSLRRLFNI